MSVVDNVRPPYVEFFARAVEDRDASIEAGHYVAKDVVFARITRPGSRDNLEREAEPWIKELQEKARQGLVPATWADGFDKLLKRWKEGEAVPVNGTPIKSWPVLSPSAAEAIIRAGFLSVEDLAAAADNEVSQIGTGALTYKQKAIAWLEASQGPGQMVEKFVALEKRLGDLVEANRTLVDANKRLQSQIDALKPQAAEKK